MLLKNYPIREIDRESMKMSKPASLDSGKKKIGTAHPQVHIQNPILSLTSLIPHKNNSMPPSAHPPSFLSPPWRPSPAHRPSDIVPPAHSLPLPPHPHPTARSRQYRAGDTPYVPGLQLLGREEGRPPCACPSCHLICVATLFCFPLISTSSSLRPLLQN